MSEELRHWLTSDNVNIEKPKREPLLDNHTRRQIRDTRAPPPASGWARQQRFQGPPFVVCQATRIAQACAVMLPPRGRGPHRIIRPRYRNLIESRRSPAIQPIQTRIECVSRQPITGEGALYAAAPAVARPVGAGETWSPAAHMKGLQEQFLGADLQE